MTARHRKPDSGNAKKDLQLSSFEIRAHDSEWRENVPAIGTKVLAYVEEYKGSCPTREAEVIRYDFKDMVYPIMVEEMIGERRVYRWVGQWIQ